MPFNNRMTPIRHHYRSPNRGLTGALTLSREVIRAHTHNRRPMFLGEFVGLKRKKKEKTIPEVLSSSHGIYPGQGMSVAWSGFYRVISYDSPCGGPKEITEFVFGSCLFISLFKGLEVRPTVATDSSCSGRNRYPGNTTNFQRCKVIITSTFKRNSYNVSTLRVR